MRRTFSFEKKTFDNVGIDQMLLYTIYISEMIIKISLDIECLILKQIYEN